MMNTEKKGFRTYENFIVITMFFAYGFIFMDRFSLSFLFPMVVPALKMNNAQVGLSMSILSITWAISSYLFSSVSDLLGTKKIFLIGAILVFSFASIGTGMATTFAFLLVMRGIMGIAEGPTGALTQAITMAESSPLRRGFNTGFVGSATGIVGTSFAALLVINMAMAWGWQSAFRVLALPGIILAVILMIFMKEPDFTAHGTKQKRQSLRDYVEVFKRRNVWVCMIMAFGMMAWWLTSLTFFALYLEKVNHFSSGQTSIFLSVYGFVGFVSAWLIASISDHLGRRIVAIVSSFFAIVAALIVLYVHSFALLTTLEGLAFLVGGGFIPIIMAVSPAESVPKPFIATAMSLIIIVGELVAGSLIPPFAGLMADRHGLAAPMWVAVGGALIVFLASFLLKETAPIKLRNLGTDNQLEPNPAAAEGWTEG